MTHLRRRDLRRAVDLVARLAELDDPGDLPGLLFPGLGELVPVEILSYHELDLMSRSSVRWEAASVEPVDRGLAPVFEALSHEHPLINYYVATGDGAPTRFSDLTSRRGLRALGIYQEFFRPLGIDHQMTVRVAQPGGLAIGLVLNRGGRDFSERDRELVGMRARRLPGLHAATRIAPRLAEAFRTGEGVGWHEHEPNLFAGTARFFRPGYAAHLVPEWLPALGGVVAKLEAGARVADVGCGYGLSTLIMAQAFPASTLVGFDYHQPSVEWARKIVAETGVADQVKFMTAGAKDFPGEGYDLITYLDCLHDMGDSVGALAHARSALAPDGTVMPVEPYASGGVEENLNPLSRLFYGVSTLICTPASLSQEVGRALGAQAGEDGMREVAAEAGFTRFRCAAQTPFNLIFEVRP